MAGIYIHIPFCRKKCYYCDFFTSQNIDLTNSFVDALLLEIDSKNNYLLNNNIETIYFGGGTPSVLSAELLKIILQKLYAGYNISSNAEITIEVNPDDITVEYLLDIKKIGFNRLSIGLQSFNNDMLKLMNRRHNSEQAIKSVEIAQQVGFNNISVDIIYGLPESDVKFLREELTQIVKLGVQHISAYHLTYETGTVFNNYLKKGKLRELPDTNSHEQFVFLTKFFEENDFEQYEISNFAKNNLYSKHNSNYWLGIEYIGLGPSAHSFNRKSRQWNVSNIKQYISGVSQNTDYYENEILTVDDRYNEYLLTSLRTKWGLDLEYINKEFGAKYLDFFIANVDKYVDNGHVVKQKNSVYLHKKSWFISDKIISELMITL